MTPLEKFKQFNASISSAVEWAGLVAFVFMMLLTTADVVGAKIFLSPIPGSLDLMMLAQLICMSFALSASYIANRHVQVEFFIPLLPQAIQRMAALVIHLFMLFFLTVMTWQLFVYGHDLRAYGEVSPTIRIPLYPFTYAAAAAFIPACLVSLAKVINSSIKVLKQ